MKLFGFHKILFGCFVVIASLSLIGDVSAQKLNDQYLQIQESIQKEPENLNHKMDLAFLFSEGREPQRAIEIYEDVLKKEPRNRRAVNELCYLFTQIRDSQKSDRYCRLATELNPQNDLVFDNLGLSAFLLGNYQKSLKPFFRALTLNPNRILTQVHTAQALFAMGGSHEAIMILEDLLKQDHLSPEEKTIVGHSLYQIFLKQRDYKKAYEAIYTAHVNAPHGLYFGKVIAAYARLHQFGVFVILSFLALVFTYYFGERINRFLKNEA